MSNHHGGCFARGTMHRIFLLLLVSALSLTCVSPAAAQKEKKKKPDASSSGDASKAPIPLTDEQQIDYTLSDMLGAWQIGDIENRRRPRAVHHRNVVTIVLMEFFDVSDLPGSKHTGQRVINLLLASQGN